MSWSSRILVGLLSFFVVGATVRRLGEPKAVAATVRCMVVRTNARSDGIGVAPL